MNASPLAEQMRPRSLKDFVGQEHIVGKGLSAGREGGIVRRLLANSKKADFFPSLVFWGPPGSGKTTLARIIARELDRPFFEFSAVNTSTKDIQKIVPSSDGPHYAPPSSRTSGGHGEASRGKQQTLERSPVVFIDEIHRFNKAQQDKLLPHVERGDILFIGATTENPSFEVIGPLLSRCRVIVLEQLTETDVEKIIKRALRNMKAKMEPKAKKFLMESANGDARVALNVLEIAKNLSGTKKISLKNMEEALQRRQLTFDKQGEEFYNVISAFIKSMRASNVDAALYYLARMVEAGQDPLYIARRMVVFASEDVGMAQPTALVVANGVFRACEVIGYPECAINLVHGVTYLAKAKKDRGSYDAYFSAVADVKKHGNLPVPMNLRNPETKLMKELGYGNGYEAYTKESLLPEKLKGKQYYKEKK